MTEEDVKGKAVKKMKLNEGVIRVLEEGKQDVSLKSEIHTSVAIRATIERHLGGPLKGLQYLCKDGSRATEDLFDFVALKDPICAVIERFSLRSLLPLIIALPDRLPLLREVDHEYSAAVRELLRELRQGQEVAEAKLRALTVELDFAKQEIVWQKDAHGVIMSQAFVAHARLSAGFHLRASVEMALLVYNDMHTNTHALNHALPGYKGDATCGHLPNTATPNWSRKTTLEHFAKCPLSILQTFYTPQPQSLGEVKIPEIKDKLVKDASNVWDTINDEHHETPAVTGKWIDIAGTKLTAAQKLLLYSLFVNVGAHVRIF